MRDHGVGRLYLHYFDVVTGDDQAEPAATLRFVKTPDAALEVVPTIYITTEAMSQIASAGDPDFFKAYADKMVTRVTAMNSRNHIVNVHEIQIDCDWTQSLRKPYFKLLEALHDCLASKGWMLSVTIRLHQLSQPMPPVDRGVLMLYNTGNLMSVKTHNSILDYEDVKPYFARTVKYDLPLDFAYPAFGWKVYYRGDKFECMASLTDTTSHPGCTVRVEQADFKTVDSVKKLAQGALGTDNSSVIIYHLDEQSLKKFTADEVEKIYGVR